MAGEIQFALYNMPDDSGKVQVVIREETIWCTQKAMAQLFGVGVPAISKHLKNIFEDGELSKDVVVSKMEITTQHGAINDKYQIHDVDFYSLDAIIAVGYRVNSLKATRFRQWATKILNEYIRKGFAMDDERLKHGTAIFGKDYFRELLERVRSIRASERRIWQQITDIYAECSIDYDHNSPTTRDFYAMIQNRFHYAITGQTAAEIVYNGADHTKDHMGLTTWKNAPDGRILKSDVSIAKNYLQEKEIRRLERAVTGFFDYIEDLIERENSFNMSQFSESVNEFLTFRRYQILPDKGKISAMQAKEKAETESRPSRSAESEQGFSCTFLFNPRLPDRQNKNHSKPDKLNDPGNGHVPYIGEKRLPRQRLGQHHCRIVHILLYRHTHINFADKNQHHGQRPLHTDPFYLEESPFREYGIYKSRQDNAYAARNKKELVYHQMILRHRIHLLHSLRLCAQHDADQRHHTADPHNPEEDMENLQDFHHIQVANCLHTNNFRAKVCRQGASPR